MKNSRPLWQYSMYVAFEAIFLKDTYKHGEIFTLILSIQVMIKHMHAKIAIKSFIKDTENEKSICESSNVNHKLVLEWWHY